MGARLRAFVDDNLDKLMEIHDFYPDALIIWLRGHSRKRNRDRSPYFHEIRQGIMCTVTSHDEALASMFRALGSFVAEAPSGGTACGSRVAVGSAARFVADAPSRGTACASRAAVSSADSAVRPLQSIIEIAWKGCPALQMYKSMSSTYM